MGRRLNLLNCAYQTGRATSVAGQFSFVSLYNNDALGRLFAVYDVGKGGFGIVFGGLAVGQGQVGSSPVNALPVVSGERNPPGQVTTGSAAATDTITLVSGVNTSGFLWEHDFPVVVLRQGFHLTVWGSVVGNIVQAGFWWEMLDSADLIAIEPPTKLEIPKVIKLTLEAE